MKAFFAVFLEFQEGKIIKQRNYDCFEACQQTGRENGGSSPRVLLPNPLLWYRSAIVLEEASNHYLGVWARFVLFTSRRVSERTNLRRRINNLQTYLCP